MYMSAKGVSSVGSRSARAGRGNGAPRRRPAWRTSVERAGTAPRTRRTRRSSAGSAPPRLRARAEITSHFAAGPQARWRGASDELYPGRGGEGRVSALLPLLDDVRHRLRRGASHLPARLSRQNVNLFLREPLAASFIMEFP